VPLLVIEFEMDTEITMTTESPMETVSPRDVDVSNEVFDTGEPMYTCTSDEAQLVVVVVSFFMTLSDATYT